MQIGFRGGVVAVPLMIQSLELAFGLCPEQLNAVPIFTATVSKIVVYSCF
jgi:hypothetical protein